MSTAIIISVVKEIRSHYKQWNAIKDDKKFLEIAANSVSNYCSQNINIKIKDMGDFNFTIGGQDNTIYKGDKDKAEDWENAFLPSKSVKMEVLGAVKNLTFPNECAQLVIMLCEDRQVYAYDGEEMHLVASSLKDLFDSGLQYPGIPTFNYGQRFENMSKKEWEEPKPEHDRKDVMSDTEFLENINQLILFDQKQEQYLIRSSLDSTKTESNMDGHNHKKKSKQQAIPENTLVRGRNLQKHKSFMNYVPNQD
ncbi:uncharacterized protein LOC117594996 [Esox lucius]|uniref:Uncharacterized protein n=1 Tax=Esox lucius TaxID=8010 RepID=A0AAY5KPS8_ESOLU|nr:uncharacterized protein LOC117594996 [Esox lucius]